jgi:hypothetical protein
VTDTSLGQVKRFMEHPMKVQVGIQHLNTRLLKGQVHAIEIRGFYMSPMEQHILPRAQICEDLFINWSEYGKSHPFKELSLVEF